MDGRNICKNWATENAERSGLQSIRRSVFFTNAIVRSEYRTCEQRVEEF